MTVAADPLGQPRIATETTRRRWRLAALLGLAVLLALSGYAVVSVERDARSNRTVAVLVATRGIPAGSVVTADELGVVNLRAVAPEVLAGLAVAGDRDRLVGQVAGDSVPVNGLVPAGLAVPPGSAVMWRASLPVRRMPAGIRPGDRVALIVSATARTGEPIEFAAMQDVRVLGIRSDSIDLWLPAAAVAQMEWYADHGGIVVAGMPAGELQQNLPAGAGAEVAP